MFHNQESKLHALNMTAKYGIRQTCETLQVSKSSIYKWQRQLKNNWNKDTVLIPRSRRPKTYRQANQWDSRITEFIKLQRKQYHFIGKDKLHALLLRESNINRWEVQLPSISSIGRILTKMKYNHEIPREPIPVSYFAASGIIRIKTKKRNSKLRPKPKDKYLPGDRVQLDTVITIKHGVRRYMIQATDLGSRICYSRAFDKLSSANTTKFFLEIKDKLPNVTSATEFQNDNGAEFQGNYQDHLTAHGYQQYWNYVHSPKMNAYVERFNRTIQEEFLNHNVGLLFHDTELFNHHLDNYILWYNTTRPHHSLDLKSPYQYLRQLSL